MRIDLNADVGEGSGHDPALMGLITSANIACGAHAGDRVSMEQTVQLARAHGVSIGAHPGFDDRAHFGRRELLLPAATITALVRRQVEELASIAPLTHVKPHGGLYTLAARDRAVADAITEAVAAVDVRLALVGLAGSQLLAAARAWGLRAVAEAFADRKYRPDGLLTPRSEPDAVIADPAVAAAQVLRIVREGKVCAGQGTEISLHAETICIHGDAVHAVALAQRLRIELADAGIAVSAF